MYFVFSRGFPFYISVMSKITDYLKKRTPNRPPNPDTSKETDVPSQIDTSNENEEDNTPNLGTASSSCLDSESCHQNLDQNGVPVQFQPSTDFSFPSKNYGNKKRSCQASWFSTYSWLHYNIGKDSVCCMVCMKHKEKLTAEHNLEDAFTTRGFNNWKKALKSFADHQGTKAHRVALAYETVVPQCGDVLEMTTTELNKKRLAEKKYLLKIMYCIRYLARQGIAFRGDNSNDNLTQLFKLLNRDDEAALKRLESDTNEKKYLHNDVQNELIEIMARQVMSKKLDSIWESQFFGIMADEYTDISNKELLSLCFRWIDESLDAHEDFLGYYELPDIKSETIVKVIKDSLIRMQLPLQDLRAQAYDGASNMFGKKSGVSVKILEEQPKALATHCLGHSLNLGIKTTMDDSKVMKDVMGTVREIICLVKYSPKRENLLGSIKDLLCFESKHTDNEIEVAPTLNKLSATRWTVRGNAYQKIQSNFDPLMKLWDVSLAAGNLDSDVKSRIIGVKSQMTEFQFFYGLNLSQRLFLISDNLSKALQKESMSALSGLELARLTIQTFKDMRTEESAKLFFDTVLKKARDHSFIDEPKLPRKRKRPNYRSSVNYMQIDGYTATGEAYHPQTVEDYYKQQYFETLELIISSIEDRFDQPSFLAFLKMEQFLLNAISGKNFDAELDHIVKVYGDDIDSLQIRTEAYALQTMFKGASCATFGDMLKYVQSQHSSKRTLIPNIITVFKLTIINPATSCTPERSFSTARRLKTWLRSTMTTKRFNNLAILTTHKELTDKIDFVSVGNEFASKHNARNTDFGKFISSDL